jgi:hypothetical protein
MIDGKRYDLDGMEHVRDEYGREYCTRYVGGVRIDAVFFGPRSKRIIVQRDSQWQDESRPGCCIGTTWSVYEPGTDDYGWFVERLERDGIYLPGAAVEEVHEPEQARQ